MLNCVVTIGMDGLIRFANAATEKLQGISLGLSLSYGIIEKHGGRIDVNSTVGVSTSFRVVLPIHHHRRK